MTNVDLYNLDCVLSAVLLVGVVCVYHYVICLMIVSYPFNKICIRDVATIRPKLYRRAINKLRRRTFYIPTASMKFIMEDLIDTFENSNEKILKRENRIELLLHILENSEYAALFEVEQDDVQQWRAKFDARRKQEKYVTLRTAALASVSVHRNRSVQDDKTHSLQHGDIVDRTAKFERDLLKLALEGESTGFVSRHKRTRYYAFQCMKLIQSYINEDVILRKYKRCLRFIAKGSTAIYLLCESVLTNNSKLAEKTRQIRRAIQTAFDGGDIDTSIYIDHSKLPAWFRTSYHKSLVNRISTLVEKVMLNIVKHDSAKRYSDAIGAFEVRKSCTTYQKKTGKSFRFNYLNDKESMFLHTSNKESLVVTRNSLQFIGNDNRISKFDLARIKIPLSAFYSGCRSDIKAEVFDLSIPHIDDDSYKAHIGLLNTLYQFKYKKNT